MRMLMLAFAAALTAAAAGCGAGPGPGQPLAPDTLRGTVRVVGADPVTQVVIRTGDAGVTVVGSATAGLRRVNGLEVMVRGRLEDDTMDAAAFRVRGAVGLPAADGVLEIHGDDAILVTADGARLRYTPIPTALRSRAGMRVWIAGEVGSEPQAWGVIGESRIR